MNTRRSVDEWTGKTPDSAVPPRVRLRVFDAKGGRCHKCGRKIGASDKWTCEHVKALCNGGENRESNLDCTCSWCLPEKNAADVKEKSKVYATRAKHVGIKLKSGRPFPKRADPWNKRWKEKTNAA